MTNSKVRESYVVLSGILGIGCNFILFTVKMFIGLSINSIAIISDAFNNITDLGSSLISILGAKFSNNPPDEGHPYGHGRLEYIASMVIAFIIFSVGYELLRSSYQRLFSYERVVFDTSTLLVLILAVAVKLWMYSYNIYISKQIKSGLNRASAYDSINDAGATSLVIVAMVIGRYVNWPIDGVAGIIISLLILYSGFDIARDTVNLLIGSAPDQEMVVRINQIICSGNHIVGCHDLKIHDYGPNRVIASIHAEVPDHLNIVEAHSSIDTLENEITNELDVDIVIHMDPISTDYQKIAAVRSNVLASFEDSEMGRNIKNFRIAQAEHKLIVIFDLETGTELSEYKANNMRVLIRDRIIKFNPGYDVVINSIGNKIPDKDSYLSISTQKG